MRLRSIVIRIRRLVEAWSSLPVPSGFPPARERRVCAGMTGVRGNHGCSRKRQVFAGMMVVL